MQKVKLGLFGIMKNESSILEEWISHYIEEGVSQIVLIDNGSNDSSVSLARKLGAKVVCNRAKNAQLRLYRKYFPLIASACNWVIVCDLDEFIYARRGFSTIKSYLESLNSSVSQVVIPWKLFGSNGHLDQPDSAIRGFTYRAIYDEKRTNQGMLDSRRGFVKSILKVSALSMLEVHRHNIRHGLTIQSNNAVATIGDDFAPISEFILKESYLNLNHYAIQSVKWFNLVKCARGDVKSRKHDSTRDLNYFTSFDYYDVEDFELSSKDYFNHLKPGLSVENTSMISLYKTTLRLQINSISFAISKIRSKCAKIYRLFCQYRRRLLR